MIPAFNEEESIADVIHSIPRTIDGVDDVEVIVIDDGSIDNTKQAAYDAGVDYVVSHKGNEGLASAFRTGITEALARGASIIVNTDADNQYDQKQIPELIKPILDNQADIVLGSRFKGTIEEMPVEKKLGNLLATAVTRILSGFGTSDAQSGFRAYSRDAAKSLKITSRRTYVQETIIRPARMNFRILEIPIRFGKRNGESRLIQSIWGYAMEVLPEMVRCYLDTFREANGHAN